MENVEGNELENNNNIKRIKNQYENVEFSSYFEIFCETKFEKQKWTKSKKI